MMRERPTLLVRHAGLVYRFDSGEDPLRDGYIRVDGPAVTAIGEEPCPWSEADEVIDASGHIVLPGLVNLHHHFWQSLTRAVPLTQACTILDWLRGMYVLWAELDPEAMYFGTKVAAAELLLTGCTTSVDFAYLYPKGQPDLLDDEIAATRELGLRLHAVRGCLTAMEGELEGELASMPGVEVSSLLESEESVLAACRRAVGRFHDVSKYSMCRIGVGPTTVTYRSPGFMRALRAFAAENACGCHVHLHPRIDERETCFPSRAPAGGISA